MKKALIIKNELSGNSNSITIDELQKVFCKDFITSTIIIKNKKMNYDVEGYDRIIVSGGDGTLSTFINLEHNATTKASELFYVSSGTLNEKENNSYNEKNKIKKMNATIGQINDHYFSYVLATGTFTPLGYVVSDREKKKHKAMAYIHYVLKEYKVHHISASLYNQDQTINLNDTYAIIMLLINESCFGLKFNRLYKKNKDKIYLLTIKAPKKKTLIGKIILFFSLFRAFIIGFNKEKRSKKINFIAIDELSIDLKKDEPFCADGELMNLNKGINTIKAYKINGTVFMLDQKTVKELIKNHKTL